jgi:hypothetical protein
VQFQLRAVRAVEGSPLEFTQEEKSAYVDSGGVTCPRCGEEPEPAAGLESEREVDGDELVEMMACDTCELLWSDIYGVAKLAKISAD